MLVIDGERFKVPAKTPAKEGLERDIMLAKEELEEIGFPIIFDLVPRLKKVDAEGHTQFPGTKRMVSRRMVQASDGGHELIFCDRFQHNEFGDISYHPRKILFSEQLIIDKKDWEKAVFLFKFSKHPDLVLYNPGKINKDLKQARELRAKVLGCIYSPEAFGLNDEVLVKIAMSYGIIETNVEIAKNLLCDKVEGLQEDRNEGYKKFLEAVKLGEAVNIRANIQIGINIPKIKDFPDQSLTWAYTSKDGKIGLGIISYNSEATKVEDLVTFFLNNKSDYKEYLAVLGKDAITIELEKKDKE